MTHTRAEPHYIVCYFGAKYAPMLGVLLQSIADVKPRRRVVLLHFDTPADVLRMASSYPNVIALPVEKQAYPTAMAAALKPLIIADYLTSPILAGPAIVVDCDMLVRQDPFDLFRPGDGILFTTRDGAWPINGGIIGMRDALDPAVSQLFHRWAHRIAEITRDPALVAIARSVKQPYGHVDQMAFAQIINYERGRKDFTILDCDGLNARAVDGYILNETRSTPVNPETRILHFKGGWHPILLDGHTFTRYRPMREGWEMFKLYCDTHASACNLAMATNSSRVLGTMPIWYENGSSNLSIFIYAVAKLRDCARSLIPCLRLHASRAFRAWKEHTAFWLTKQTPPTASAGSIQHRS